MFFHRRSPHYRGEALILDASLPFVVEDFLSCRSPAAFRTSVSQPIRGGARMVSLHLLHLSSLARLIAFDADILPRVG